MSCVADDLPALVNDEVAKAAVDNCGSEWGTKDDGDENQSCLIRSWMRGSAGGGGGDGHRQALPPVCDSEDYRLEPVAAGADFDRDDGTWSSLSLLQMRRGSMASVSAAHTGQGGDENSAWIDNLLLEALEEHSCGHLHLRHKSVMFYYNSFSMDSSMGLSQKMDVSNSTTASSSTISRGLGRSCKCRITMDPLTSAKGTDAQAKIVWKLSEFEKVGFLSSFLAFVCGMKMSREREGKRRGGGEWT